MLTWSEVMSAMDTPRSIMNISLQAKTFASKGLRA